MQASQLKPASSFALNLGAKVIAYGPPGEGKTPLIKTAPRPVLLVCEPGMLSMRDATNIPAWEGYTVAKINEFLDWVFRSNEAKAFDTICIDSFSQLAEIRLKEELNRNTHGLKAYGEMSRAVMERAEQLFFMPQKHVYLIAKQMTSEEGGVKMRRPYFPGQDLNVRMPHLFDGILHVSRTMIPGFVQPQLAIRTRGTLDITARVRGGMVDELEPPDLAALFRKMTKT
jgi:hypothetical protein